jgi:hypothetical protein
MQRLAQTAAAARSTVATTDRTSRCSVTLDTSGESRRELSATPRQAYTDDSHLISHGSIERFNVPPRLSHRDVMPGLES